MRSVKVVVGLVAALCAFSALSAAAFARVPKEEIFFGEFVATRAEAPVSEADPGQLKGKGEVEELRIGPYGLKNCKMIAKSSVTQERSKTLFTNLSVKCKTISHPEHGKNINEIKNIHFKLGLKFNANKSAQGGQGNEAGTSIEEGTEVPVSIGSSKCKMRIPPQFLPGKAGTSENHEYESAEYETEEEEVEGAKLKTYPSGFHDQLNIFWTLHKVKSELVTGPLCTVGPEEEFGEQTEEGGTINKEGNVEYKNGKFEGSIELLTLRKGNISFDEEPPEV